MTQPIPVSPSQPPDPADEALVALFDQIEKDQLHFLDEAGKRLIELSTALIGLQFGVAAFGSNFPPPYLMYSPALRFLFIGITLAYFLALLCGFRVVQPRQYNRYASNVTRLRQELDKITAHKAWWFRAGSILFVIATAALAVLVALIVL
jgi:hypothetical protein